MEPTGKIDIKSEVYRAAVPHISRWTKVAYARYRVLPKGDVIKNFAIIYLAAGFIIEGIAGALPAYAVSFVGLPGGIVGFIFFMFWPVITWLFISPEHAFLSLAILFIGATYTTHLKQRNVEAFAMLQSVQVRPALTEDRIFEPQIDMPMRIEDVSR